MGRSFKRTWFYVGKEFFFSFIVAFLFFFFIFFINQILLMAEQIFSKKVPFWDVVKLIIYSLPFVVALSFPFGSLVGALMAVGRLSSDNEVLAFSVLGVPLRHVLLPFIALGVIFFGVSFIMNDYFFPLGTIRFTEIYRRILYSNPALELEPHSIKKYENTVIVTGGVSGKKIQDVIIIDKSPEGSRRVITAGAASLSESAETLGVISLTLERVFSHFGYPKEGDRYDYFTASEMVYSILLKNITSSIGNLTPAQQSSADVWKQIRVMSLDQAAKVEEKMERVREIAYNLAQAVRSAREDASIDEARLSVIKKNLEAIKRQYDAEMGKEIKDRNLQNYLMEFHWKFSVPAACLVFAFFAFPIGLLARRSGRTVGFAIGLLVSIVYYGLLLVGRTFGGRIDLPPAVSMWFPDALVLLAGVVIFSRRRVR
jgi:lipopolysaccharide export system permease protein